jgi:HD-GYP domain-containing protein (c-di-GMP phosphodiesterase class II)
VKLFRTLLLLMLIASLVPTVMVGGLSLADARKVLSTDAQELAQERVKRLRQQLLTVLDEPTRAAAVLARGPELLAAPLADQRAQLAAVLNQRREVTVVTLFGADRKRLPGLQAFASKEIPPTELAEHEAQAEKLLPGLTGVRTSPAYASPSRGEPVVTVAFPVGEPAQGYAALEIGLASLASSLAQERVGANGFAYVVDRQGRLVAGSGRLATAKTGEDEAQRPPVAHMLQTLAASPESEAFHVGNFGQGATAVIGAYTSVPDLGWAVVSEQPLADAYRQVEAMRRRMAASLTFALLVAVVLAATFSNSVTRPLRGFSAGALEIAKGKFGVKVVVKRKNELGELAQTFNYMSSQLDAYDQENKRLYESLEHGYLETIVALANSIDSKDAYTRGHSQRVGDLAVQIGAELGLTPRSLKHLHYGGILHDIGKIGIVESILCKQSRLTEEEMVIMREHPAIGDTIIQPVSFLKEVRAAVRNHHERWDGNGYPDKLKGEQIPMMARIVNCADTFDACTSTRPYQKAKPLDLALEIMESLRGSQLDPKVLDALHRVVEKRGVRLEGSRQPVKLAS